MSKYDISEMTCVQRNVPSYANANSPVAAVLPTVWRHTKGTFYRVAKDPAQLPALKKLMGMEVPNV